MHSHVTALLYVSVVASRAQCRDVALGDQSDATDYIYNTIIILQRLVVGIVRTFILYFFFFQPTYGV